MESFFSKYGTIKTRKSLFQKGYEKLRNVMYHKSRFSEYRQSSDANLGTMQKRIKNRPHVLQKDSSMICKRHVANYIKSFVKHERSACSRV
ncbi:unnamed protein product [Rhizophagus irregularis]|nr:unnamed protein product [Rhizophagus irregularis]